ncbi:MAG TPA: glycosyltransferase family A protein [Anaerolineales bacterium]|nr:glycosyltransferase family A protein [Anaerolineales bacterium]
MAPKVTVIIPTFNRCEFLAECLDSILAQTLPPHQTIVINDGSTDRTPEVLKPYLPRIEYLETENRGRAAASNEGILRASGEYIWIFDDDDVALPDALERFTDTLEKHPEYSFSFSSYYYMSSDPDENRAGCPEREFVFPDLQTRGAFLPILEGGYINGAGLFSRAVCYKTLGLLDTSLVRSSDYEFAIRLVRHFEGIRPEGGPTFRYRQHDLDRGNKQDRFRAKERFGKWMQYDQVIFRRLYRELPLTAYLPPGCPLENHERQAHLERLAVMGTKHLLPEISAELQILSRLRNQASFTMAEHDIVVSMVTRSSAYLVDGMYDRMNFMDEVRHLSASPVIRKLRREIVAAILVRLTMKRKWSDLRQVYGAFRRAVRLYFPL